MRAVLSLVRASLAGIGGFALVTAAFCVAMTLAISGPPTPQEMAEVEVATQTVLQEADVAVRAFGDRACRKLDLDCALQQDARIAPPHVAPRQAEPPPAPIIIAEVAPPEPEQAIAAPPEEPHVTSPRARESAARRTPNVRARRAAAERQTRTRVHRREATGARPHRPPRPRRAPLVTRATPHTAPPAAPQRRAQAPPPERAPAPEEVHATTVNAPEPRAEPAPEPTPEPTPSAARNHAAIEDRQASPAEEHNAREQPPAPDALELPPSSDAT